jgi:hypothetical protein
MLLSNEFHMIALRIEENAREKKPSFLWEIMSTERNHPLFVDVNGVPSALLPDLIRNMQSKMSSWFDEREDKTLAVLKTVSGDDYRFIWPRIIQTHDESLCTFDALMVATTDINADFDFDRTYLDNGWIRMLWSEEISHTGIPMERKWIPHQFWGANGLQLDREGGLPLWLSDSKLWSCTLSIAHSPFALCPTAEMKSFLKEQWEARSYRKKTHYPTKVPWLYRHDKNAWRMNDPSTFNWSFLQNKLTKVWSRYSNEKKINEVIKYMNRFFAVITLDSAVQVVVKTWDPKKEGVKLVYRSLADFVSMFENKKVALNYAPPAKKKKTPAKRKPVKSKPVKSKTKKNSRSRQRKKLIKKKRSSSSKKKKSTKVKPETSTANELNWSSDSTSSSSSSSDEDTSDADIMDIPSFSSDQDVEEEVLSAVQSDENVLYSILNTSARSRNNSSNIKFESIGKLWRFHPHRKEFSQVVFNPFPNDHVFGSQPEELNRWNGLRYSYKECKRCLLEDRFKQRSDFILEHKKDILCSNNEESYNYLLPWMACKLINPWNKIHTLVSFYGKEGCGKGIFLSKYCHLFGRHGWVCHDMQDIIGRFNEILEDKILVWIDEGISPQSKKEISRLKTMITETEMRNEGKYKPQKNVDNFISFMSASNLMSTLPVGPTNRRFFCLDVNNKYSMDSVAGKKHFGKLLHAMEDEDYGGLKAYQAVLMETDISEFDKGQDIPSSSLLRIQRHESLDAVGKWWYKCLLDGMHCKLSDLPDKDFHNHFNVKDGRVPHPVTGVYETAWIREISKPCLYKCFTESTTRQDACSSSMFWGRMKELVPGIIYEIKGELIAHRYRVEDNGNKTRRKSPYVILPELDECRRQFTAAMNLPFDDLDAPKRKPSQATAKRPTKRCKLVTKKSNKKQPEEQVVTIHHVTDDEDMTSTTTMDETQQTQQEEAQTNDPSISEVLESMSSIDKFIPLDGLEEFNIAAASEERMIDCTDNETKVCTVCENRFQSFVDNESFCEVCAAIFY